MTLRPLRWMGLLLALTSGCGTSGSHYATQGRESGGRATRQQGGPGREMYLVETGRKGAFYLVDPGTSRCWFQEGPKAVPIACAQVPEAAELLAEQRAVIPAGPEAQAIPREVAAARPRPITARPAPPEAPPATVATPEVVERLGEAPRHVGSKPAAPVAPAEPAAPRRDNDLGPAPTAAEKRSFTLAYISVYCDRREGGQADPARLIGSQGLSLPRYGEIEGWMASDPVAWRNLQAAAASACPLGETGGTPPDPETP